MKKFLQKIAKWFKKHTFKIALFLTLVGGGFVSIFLTKRSSDEKDIGITDPDATNRAITGRRVSEFRDRSEQVVRGLFDNRGVTDRPGDSGAGDSNSGGGDSQDVYGRPGEEEEDNRNPGEQNSEPGSNQDNNNRTDNNLRGNNTYSFGSPDIPITPDNIFFFESMEGNLIRRNGAKLLALLAPQQLASRALTAKEVVAIYNQARKDPAIMSRNCVMGRKGYLVTYHAAKILGVDMYLQPSEKADITVCGYNKGEKSWYEVLDRDGVIVYMTGIGTGGSLVTKETYKVG